MPPHLDEMANRHDRMAEDHSRAGVAHNFSNSLAPRFLVAVNFAAATRHFILAMRTMFHAPRGIVE